MQIIKVDISNKKSYSNKKTLIKRIIWSITWICFFKTSPRTFHKWRNLLLRLFGATLHPTARVYPTARIYAPWNLIMHEHATMGDWVNCYCVDIIEIGAHTTISQYAYLCGADHDYEHHRFPLRPKKIKIGEQCWIAADVFIAPGVTIGNGTVIGARSSVFNNLPAWKVCIGTPAKILKDRIIKQ